jgi:hypothetical protein
MLLLNLLSLLAASAEASPIDQGQAAANALLRGALADISFLEQNADKCTRYGDRVRDQFLAPMRAELLDHQTKLEVFSAFAPLAPGCTAPAQSDFANAKESASLVAAAIALRIQQAETPQGQFFGYSGDQVMNLALEAGPGFPECVPEEAGNPRSTRELKTYYAMKAKLVELGALSDSLALECGKALENQSAPVCRN